MLDRRAATDCCMGLAGLKIPDDQDITLQALFRLGQYSGKGDNIPLARSALCPAKCLRSACLECLTFIDRAKIKVAPPCLAWYTSIRHIAASIGQHSRCSKGPCMAAGSTAGSTAGLYSTAQPSPAQPSPACNFAWHNRHKICCKVLCDPDTALHYIQPSTSAERSAQGQAANCFKDYMVHIQTGQHSGSTTGQHRTIQHSKTQHSTAQRSTAQHSTAQHSQVCGDACFR